MAESSQGKHARTSEEEIVSAKKPWRASVIALLGCSIAAFVAIITFVLLNNKEPLGFDSAILDFAVSIRSNTLTKLAMWITMIAMPPAWIVVAAALSVYAEGPRPFLAIVCSGGIGWVLNEAIKHLVNRPRPPEELRLALETSSSFPSGHSITAVALYGFLVWLLLRYMPRGTWRNVLVVLVSLIIVLIGATRIYLGVHWTSDVLGGFSFGMVWLVLYTRLIAPRILGD